MHRPKKHSDLNNGYLITLVPTPAHLGHEVVMLVYCNVGHGLFLSGAI